MGVKENLAKPVKRKKKFGAVGKTKYHVPKTKAKVLRKIQRKSRARNRR